MCTSLKKNIYIKVISIITIVSFLAYDIAWAYPEKPRVSTDTLLQQTIFTLPDKDASHARVAARYLEEMMAKRLAKEPLAGVQEMLEFIRGVASDKLEIEGKNFSVSGGAEEGQVFVFLDDDLVLRYYNPRMRGLALPAEGMREVGDYPLNKYLNFQLLRVAVTEEEPVKGKKASKRKIRKPAPTPVKTDQDIHPVYLVGTRIASDVEYVRANVIPAIPAISENSILIEGAGDGSFKLTQDGLKKPDIKKIERKARKVRGRLRSEHPELDLADVAICLTESSVENSYRVYSSPDRLEYLYSIAVIDDTNGKHKKVFMTRDLFMDLSANDIVSNILAGTLSHYTRREDDLYPYRIRPLPYSDNAEGRSRRSIEASLSGASVKRFGLGNRLQSAINYMLSKNRSLSETDREIYLRIAKAFIKIQASTSALKLSMPVIAGVAWIFSLLGIPAQGLAAAATALTVFCLSGITGSLIREITTLGFKLRYRKTPMGAIFAVAWIPQFIGFTISIPVQIGVTSVINEMREERKKKGAGHKSVAAVALSLPAVAWEFLKTYGVFFRQLFRLRKLKNTVDKVKDALKKSTLNPEDIRFVLEQSYDVAEMTREYEDEKFGPIAGFQVSWAGRGHEEIAKIAGDGPVLLFDANDSYLRLWKRLKSLGESERVDLFNLYVFDVYKFYRSRNMGGEEGPFIVRLEEYISDNIDYLEGISVDEGVKEKGAAEGDKQGPREKKGYSTVMDPTPASTIGLLDMTLLVTGSHHKGEPIKEAVTHMAENAVKYGSGGVCVYPEQLAWIKDIISGTGIEMAAVIAFPGGLGAENGTPVEKALEEARTAIRNGATELDVVLNYKAVIEGRYDDARDQLKEFVDGVRNEHGDAAVRIKTILETAALEKPELVRKATQIALPYSDIIKTSTGKHEKGGASLEASRVILTEIKKYHENTGTLRGHKPSGGIKVWDSEEKPDSSAKRYLELAREVIGEDYVRSRHRMRFGASSILDDLLKRSPAAYLCGAIESLMDKDAGSSWRDWIEPRLKDMGIVPLNPLKAPKSPEDMDALREKHRLKVEGRWDRHKQIMDTVMVDDIEMVAESGRSGGFNLVYLDSHVNAFGTFCEMIESYKRGIPTYVVAPNNPESDLHNMTLLLATRVFRSFEEFFAFIDSGYEKGEAAEDRIFEPLAKKTLWRSDVRAVTPEEDPRGIKGRVFYVTSQIEAMPDAGVAVRNRLGEKLRAKGAVVEDPGIRYDREGPMESKYLKHLKRTGQWDEFYEAGYKVIRENMLSIEKADSDKPSEKGAMVVYIDEQRRSAGSAMDMWNAYVKGIPIYLILAGNRSKADYNSWMLNMATAVFEAEDELLLYLESSTVKRAFLRKAARVKSAAAKLKDRLKALKRGAAKERPETGHGRYEGEEFRFHRDLLAGRIELAHGKKDGSIEEYFEKAARNGVKDITVFPAEYARIQQIIEEYRKTKDKKARFRVRVILDAPEDIVPARQQLGAEHLEVGLDITSFRRGRSEEVRTLIDDMTFFAGEKENLVISVSLADLSGSELHAFARMVREIGGLSLKLVDCSLEEFTLFRSIVGRSCRLSVAGVRDFDQAKSYLRAGADKIETSAPGEIVEGYNAWSRGDLYRRTISSPSVVFAKELSIIGDVKMKEFAVEAMKLAPSYIWEIPSSSSGKYHRTDEITLGGLVIHIKRVFEAARKISESLGLSDRDRDMLLVAALLHDTAKYGYTDEIFNDLTRRWGYYYRHPELVRIMTEGLAEKYDFYDDVLALVEGHSGRWSNEGFKPETEMQWLMHLADYFAAQRYSLDVDAFITYYQRLVEAGASPEQAITFLQVKQEKAFELLKELEEPSGGEDLEKIRASKDKIMAEGLRDMVLDAGSEEAREIILELAHEFIDKYRVKVYLAGYIEADIGGASGWRDRMKPLLEDMYVEVRDPMAKDFNSEDLVMDLRKNWMREAELWDDFRQQLGVIIDEDLSWVVGGGRTKRGVQLVISNLVPAKEHIYLDPGVQTFGTLDEMKEARKQGARIVIFTPNREEDLYNFEVGFGQEVFNTQEDVLSYISKNRDSLREYGRDDIHKGTPLEKAYWQRGMRPVAEGAEVRGVKGRRFYISVPTEPSPDQGYVLRARVKREIEKRGGIAIDPLSDVTENERLTKLREEGRWKEFDALFRRAYRSNLRKIAGSDAVVVMVDPKKRYIGTTSDTWPAFVLGKPIYVVTPHPWRKLSDWLTGLYTKKFDSLEDLFHYLKTGKAEKAVSLVDHRKRMETVSRLRQHAAGAEASTRDELNLLILRGLTNILRLQRHGRQDTEDEILVQINAADLVAEDLDPGLYSEEIEKFRKEMKWWNRKIQAKSRKSGFLSLSYLKPESVIWELIRKGLRKGLEVAKRPFYLWAVPEEKLTKAAARWAKSLSRSRQRFYKKAWLMRAIGPDKITSTLLKYSLETLKKRKMLLDKYEIELNSTTVRLKTEEDIERWLGRGEKQPGDEEVEWEEVEVSEIGTDLFREITGKDIKLVVTTMKGVLAVSGMNVSERMCRKLDGVSKNGIELCVLTVKDYREVGGYLLSHLPRTVARRMRIFANNGADRQMTAKERKKVAEIVKETKKKFNLRGAKVLDDREASVICMFRSRRAGEVAAYVTEMLEKAGLNLSVSLNKTDGAVKELFISPGNKAEALKKLLKELEIKPEETLYIARDYGTWSSNRFVLDVPGLNVIQTQNPNDTEKVLEAVAERVTDRPEKWRRRISARKYQAGDRDATVNFIDVKDGDGIFIRTSSGKNILIDAGEGTIRFLRRRGITELDQVVITHGHSDHTLELARIMEDFKVKQVVDPGFRPANKSWYRKIRRLTRKNGADLIFAGEGDKLDWGEGLDVEVLNPPKKQYQPAAGKTASSSEENNNGLVILMKHGEVSFLFTGDMEKDAERRLIGDEESREKIRDVDVLKLGHHGSSHSSTKKFIDVVSPELAVAMIPDDAPSIYPSQRIINSVEKYGETLSTSAYGTISVTTNGRQYKVESLGALERDRDPQYEAEEPGSGELDFPAIMGLSQEELEKEEVVLSASVTAAEKISLRKGKGAGLPRRELEAVRKEFKEYLAAMEHAPPLKKFKVGFRAQRQVASAADGVLWFSWGVIRLLLMNDARINNFLLHVLFHEFLHLGGETDEKAVLDRTRKWFAGRPEILRHTIKVLRKGLGGVKGDDLLGYITHREMTSHTRLTCFENCPLRFKYKYMDRKKPGKGSQTIEQVLGICVHGVMEKLYGDHLYKDKLMSLDEMLEYYDALWKENFNDDVIIARKDRGKEFYYDRGKDCIRWYYNEYHPFDQSRTIAVEKMIRFDPDGSGRYQLLGFIDRLAVRNFGAEDEVWEIHDYKTSEKAPEQAKLDMDRQLALYQIAIQRMWPRAKKVELIWHYVAAGVTMKSTRTAEQLEELQTTTIERIEEIEKRKKEGTFDPQKSYLCPWCEYKDSICPEFAGVGQDQPGEDEEQGAEVDIKGVKEKALVDEYVELYGQKKDSEAEAGQIKAKLDEIKARMLDHCEREGVTVLAGSSRMIKLSTRDILSLPRKKADKERLVEIIKEAGLWDDVSGVDAGALKKAMDDGTLPEEAADAVKNLVEVKEQTYIRVTDKEKKKGKSKKAKAKSNEKEQAEPAEEEDPERKEPHRPDYYSHSRLMKARTCPFSYKKHYMDREKERHTTIEIVLGIVFHETMEKLYLDLKEGKPAPSLDELLAYYEERWKENYTEEAIVVREEMEAEDYHRLGRRFVRDYYNRNAPFDEDETIGVELEVELDLEEITGRESTGKYKIKGFIDLVRLSKKEENGKVIYEIHDYKTSRHLPTQEEADSDDDKFRQLALYQLGLRNQYPDADEVRLVWHYVAFDMEVVSSRTPEQLKRLAEDSIRWIDENETMEEFPARKTALCPWCGYKKSCPLFKHLERIRGLTAEQAAEDEGYALVEEYAALHDQIKSIDARVEELDEQLYALKEKVLAYAEAKGKEALVGSEKILKFTHRAWGALPSTDRKKALLSMLLREAGIWADSSRLDPYALLRALERGDVPEETADRIREIVNIHESAFPHLVNRPRDEEEDEEEHHEVAAEAADKGQDDVRQDAESMAAGLGVYEGGGLDQRVRVQIDGALERAEAEGRALSLEDVDDGLKADIIIAGDEELTALLGSRNVYLVKPASEVKAHSPPVLWGSVLKRFVLSYVKDGKIYLPVPLIPVLIKARKLDMLKSLIMFEKGNIENGFEDTNAAESLAQKFLITYSAGKVSEVFIKYWGLLLGAASVMLIGCLSLEITGAASLWQLYLGVLSRYPLMGKALTALTSAAAGNYIAQRIEQRRIPSGERRTDRQRLLRVSFLFMLLNGFALHYWLEAISVLGAGAAGATLKLICHTAVFVPVLYIVFLAGNVLLSKTNIREIFTPGAFREAASAIKNKFWSMFKADLVFWTCGVNPFNFFILPGVMSFLGIDPSLTNGLIVFVISTAYIPWSAFISLKAHRKDNLMAPVESPDKRRLKAYSGGATVMQNAASMVEDEKRKGYPEEAFTPSGTIGLLDLTMLTRENNYKGVPIRKALEEMAKTAVRYRTGGVCMYHDQLAWVKDIVEGTGIEMASVIAFPGGLGEENGTTVEKALDEAREAIENGATELDVVINYNAILEGKDRKAEQELKEFVRGVEAEHGKGKVRIKTILETGALETAERVRRATRIALPYSDIIKTSTGKHEKGGATLMASRVILEEINNYYRVAGVLRGHKPSGGIKVWESAEKPDSAAKNYLKLAADIMDLNYIQNKSLMRFGASSVLDNLLSHIEVDVGWEPVEKLKEAVSASRADYDCVVGILNGGKEPAKAAAEALGVPVYWVRAKSYKGKKRGDIVFKNVSVPEDIKDKRVLLVDDIYDSGATLRHTRKWLQQMTTNPVEAAVLMTKDKERSDGDGVIAPVNWTRKEWPRFPWEKGEKAPEGKRTEPGNIISRMDSVVPELVNGLITAGHRKGKFVIAIDEELGPESTRAELERVRQALSQLSLRSDLLGDFLKDVVVRTGKGSELSKDLGSLVEKGGVRKEDITIITNSKNVANFSSFEGASTITGLDDEEMTDGFYYPLVEVVLFSIGKTLNYKKKELIRLYNKIPNIVRLSDEDIWNMCWDEKTKTYRTTMVLRLIPGAVKVPDKGIYKEIQRYIASRA